MSKSNKIILKGEFQRFAPVTYPNCQNYDKYTWNWDLYKWVLSDKWKRFERGLKIKNIKRHEKKN